MFRLIFVLLTLALSSCAAPGQRLVDMERCLKAVPSNLDEDGKARAMDRCMFMKGYWVLF
jgi:hypothetical protein